MTVLRSLWYGEILVTAKTMKQIAAEVAAANEISLKDLMGRSSVRKFAWPRQQAMYLMAVQTYQSGAPRYSMPMIGEFFSRDHTTVLHGIRAYAEREDLEFKPRSKSASEYNAVRSGIMAARRAA